MEFVNCAPACDTEESTSVCDITVKIEPLWVECDVSATPEEGEDLFPGQDVKHEPEIKPFQNQEFASVPSVVVIKEELPDDVPPLVHKCGPICPKESPSSFGSPEQHGAPLHSNMGMGHDRAEPSSSSSVPGLMLTCVNCGKIITGLHNSEGPTFFCILCSHKLRANLTSIEEKVKNQMLSNSPSFKGLKINTALAIDPQAQTLNGDKPFSCDVCHKQFKQKYLLNTHVRRHTGEKPYHCEECDKRFTESRDLSRHMRVHTDQKPHTCSTCNKGFADISALTSHQRIHTGEKPYQCEICQKRFTQLGHLTKHVTIHSGEKPYSCTECDKQFKDKAALNRHIQIHTGEKPYTCDICTKQFADSSNLAAHKRIHTGAKPHLCVICNKLFTTKSTLKSHKRIHTGQKPYSCEVCNKQFTHLSNMTRHRRIHKTDVNKK